jgi:hypothetical protein
MSVSSSTLMVLVSSSIQFFSLMTLIWNSILFWICSYAWFETIKFLFSLPLFVLQSAQDAGLLVNRADPAAFIRCPVRTAGGTVISSGTPGAGVANQTSSDGSFYVDSQGRCHSIGRLRPAHAARRSRSSTSASSISRTASASSWCIISIRWFGLVLIIGNIHDTIRNVYKGNFVCIMSKQCLTRLRLRMFFNCGKCANKSQGCSRKSVYQAQNQHIFLGYNIAVKIILAFYSLRQIRHLPAPLICKTVEDSTFVQGLQEGDLDFIKLSLSSPPNVHERNANMFMGKMLCNQTASLLRI